MKLRDYLPTSEAAVFLGVSADGVRNRDWQGNLRPRWLPHKSYHLFLKSDLDAFHQQIKGQGDESANSPRRLKADRS